MSVLNLPVGLLALLAVPTVADFPYNPTRIFLTNNRSAAYIFSSQPSTSQVDLQLLNTSSSIDISKPLLSTLTSKLPFLDPSAARPFTTLLNGNELNVLAGDCNDGLTETELWHYTPDRGDGTGAWDKLSLSSTDSTLNSNFLSAGFSFSPTASLSDASFYLFGGMCPNNTSTAEDWTLNAAYLNDMLSITPDASSLASYPKSTYESSTLLSRGPPVAEAGLSITPLTPTYSNISSASVSQQQSFVLIGGHTQQAFINMSQVAIFSLPQESWSFEAIKQPAPGKTDLMARSSRAEVEPRSGHTAVLTPDGSKIVVFGGWVGDVSTPAEPQLAILEIGQGYGGMGDWSWTAPTSSNSPLKSGQGIYGHGAAMLEGGVMLVSGGYSISASSAKIRRKDVQAENTQMFLFNVTSSSFVSTYTNPVSSNSVDTIDHKISSGALRTTSQRVGLGAGLVLGFAALAGIVVVYIFYSRRLRQKRAIREKELRELALGAEHYYSGDIIGGGVDGRGGPYPEMRTASWGSRQERRISGPTDDFPWAPVASAGQARHGENGMYGNGEREAERTGLLVEIPSPTRGLRRSLHSKGPMNYSPSAGVPSIPYGNTATTGEIHTITEQDEESEAGGSLRRPKSCKSKRGDLRPNSDPFKDPPPQLTRSQSEVDRLHRQREVKGWVDDWEVAGAAMESGRPLQHSSSTKHDQSHSNSNTSRSISPEKSDRTNSNLSERSTVSSSSIQRSLFGSISRNMSIRSASAGYTLFANAAAAMTGRATLVHHPGPSPPLSEGNTSASGVARGSSKRSASLNFNSGASTRYKGGSGSQRERSDTFSTAHTSVGAPQHPGENDALLSRGGGSARQGGGYEEVFETPPESPVRERERNGYIAGSGSGSGPGRKARGWMGSMRRALTGAGTGGASGGGGVRRQVEEYESRHQPQMMEVNSSPRRAASASAAFWRGKKGARDWDVEPSSPTTGAAGPSSAIEGGTGAAGKGTGTVVRRKPVPGSGQAEQSPATEVGKEADADSEWDVEAAVQKRLVQVMFTVPKERLRVVNVDQLSLVSKSDVGEGEGEGKGEGTGEGRDEVGNSKRVSTVVEESETPVGDGDGIGEEDERWKGKGKGKEKEKRLHEG